MKYVVTGVNRLTGEREAISLPHAEWKAHDLMRKYKGYQVRAGKKQRIHQAEGGACQPGRRT